MTHTFTGLPENLSLPQLALPNKSFTDTEIVAMGKKGNELDVIPALEEVTV